MSFASTMSSLARLSAAALLAAAVLAGTASARDLTEAENAALAQAVEDFDTAIGASDMETVIKTVPPKVIASIAEQGGLDVEQLRQVIIEQSKKAMANVTISSFGMDLETAEQRELADGTPFVLIPTETVMDAGSGKIRATSKTLALLDEGVWYLLRIDDVQQMQILKTVYPEFAGVEFERGTMEAVE
jgi:hypothetical protein